MKVLLVAPTQLDLKTQPDEVQRLVNVLNAKLVIGNVSCADVTDAINAHKPDVLWFASHGDWNGIMLTGCVLDAEMLSAAIRGTNTSLVVLNSCDSRAVAERIYASTGAHVVATVGKIDDRRAFVTAQRFAVLLNTGLSPFDAFQRAKSSSFIYIPEPIVQPVPSTSNTTTNGNGYEGLRRAVAELQMQVDRRDLIIEHLRTDMAAVVTQFQALQVRFQALQDDQEKRLSSLQTSMWLLAGLMVIVLAVVLQMSMGTQ